MPRKYDLTGTAPRGPKEAAGVAVPSGVRRGRPAAVVYAPEEVADLLGLEVGWVLRALDRDAPAFFPGAFREGGDGEWRVPQRTVRMIMGPREERLYPVADFAALIGFSVPVVYERIASGELACRVVWGHKRIPASAYYALGAGRPAGTAARPSFFLEGKRA